MSAVHRHTYSDVAERLNAVIAVQERGTKRITHADMEVFTALIILGAVSNRVGINNWKAPDTSLVFCGVDFTVYQSLATSKLIKKYYSWADAGTAEEIAADPWMRFRPGIDKFNATQRSFVEPTLECVVDESMSPYEPRSSATGTLPNLSFIVRKPEPLGSELKDTCDGGTGCMLHAEVQEGKDAMHSKAYFGLQVGTLGVVGATAACTLRMMEASCQHNGLLFGDSWFGSVLACVAGRLVLRNGLKVHSMFAIKTGHRFFPKEYIEQTLAPLPAGARIVLTATVEGVALVALGYKYNRKKVLSFVMTRGAGRTTDGEPYIQKYCSKTTRQVRQRSVGRPHIISQYFRHSALIDNHNQARQGLLQLEKAWVVQCGFLRLSTTLLGMELTNAWKAAGEPSRARTAWYTYACVPLTLVVKYNGTK